ncbi:MaoC like domain protein [Nonomuraea coxensis DSM 45129]|uniref:MaoC like domain protein n=1 Tax=Nonomuraea coxensis DSM 45129 TaxID=1122611 RepID=A0ABX8U1L4_9ACTN|nr:MaoC family dehydratase [Nonomuraea coxensis]QYC41555.1 MaoC like domain protein [Nonomuraea coxensis DSM 45129]
MPIDASLVGRKSEPVTRSWTSDDALLYAIAVGAGQEDPLSELQFTTENTEGTPQQVLPTFCNVAMGGGMSLPTDLDFTKMLHAEQAFELFDTIPVAGEVESTGEIVGVYDKGSGALIATESVSRVPGGGPLAKIRTSLFFRGYGGFGGERGPGTDWERPTGKPDHVVTYTTRADQALLYRLTGDRNPLHTDPSFSGRGGFPRPILHGMCTYGFTGRALLHTVAGSEPKRFRAMSARFTKPILPGQTITVSIWADGTDVRFQTTDESGTPVIDHGTAVIL